jgi:hypothetical protein
MAVAEESLGPDSFVSIKIFTLMMRLIVLTQNGYDINDPEVLNYTQMLVLPMPFVGGNPDMYLVAGEHRYVYERDILYLRDA